MLALAAIGLWTHPAVSRVSQVSEPVPLDARPGLIGALARNEDYRATLSGTLIHRAPGVATTWLLYPGACQDRALGTWAVKTSPVADSLDTYAIGGQGGYGREDQSLAPKLWHVVGAATASSERPTILAGNYSIWCGKYDPNWVIRVGYPNLTYQILYIDTGAHSANYNFRFLMNQSTEQDYDFVYLIGGGGGAVDPIGNSRARFDEIVATGSSADAHLLVSWVGSIMTTTPGAISINTVGNATKTIVGSGSGEPSPIVPVTISIDSFHRALYFLFTADCGVSSEDGGWPVGRGAIYDEISTSDHGVIFSDSPAAGGVDPTGGDVIVGAFGTSPYVAARVFPGTGELWQIVSGSFASTSDFCAPEKNDAADRMFFGADASSKKAIPGQFNSIVSCAFPVPPGAASIFAYWAMYLDLPRTAGYVQYSEYRFFKSGAWSNWQNTHVGGGTHFGPVKIWFPFHGDELAAAAQADSVQLRYSLQCVPALSPGGVDCGLVEYAVLYDDLRLEVLSGVPAPLISGVPAVSTFVDGTMRGLNCATPPCWPGIRGTDIVPTAEDPTAGVRDNFNGRFSSEIAVAMATGLRKNGMGINWRHGFDLRSVDLGSAIVHVNGSYNPLYDVPRMIYRIFDPATKTWSPFDSTELYASGVSISAGDTTVAGALLIDWPPWDKAGRILPGGFTVNGVAAYGALSFLPRGTRLQYYWKAVDINGGIAYQFAGDALPHEVEDLPTLPGGAAKAPDITEFDVLPRVYTAGSPGSLLAGRTNTPILNLDGAYLVWSFQYDPMTQALRGLGVRADRFRQAPAARTGTGIGGHELTTPPDNQRPFSLFSYFPNMTEYGIKDSLALWYRIIIQSSHLRASIDDEPDARLLEEWWSAPTPGANGGDRCIFVSGDDYFNQLLNVPAGESSVRRISFGQNVLGVNSTLGPWSGTATNLYPTVEDRFANPGAGPGLAAGYTYPVDGGCPNPNRFDALTKSSSSEFQNAAFYPLVGGVADVAAVATHAERDPLTDYDRNKALGYGFSIQFVRKADIPPSAENYVRSGAEERMRILYKFLTSCRGARSGAPDDTAKCWPCPGDAASVASMTGNWAATPAFLTGKYGPLYPIQDNQAATGVAVEVAPAAPQVNLLQGNFPNPFNPQTTIKFASAQAGRVTIRIFNVGGQMLRTISTKVEAGSNEVRWNGRRDDGAPVASGIYFYKIRFADGHESGSRMALVK